jgi:hypothetical protein
MGLDAIECDAAEMDVKILKYRRNCFQMRTCRPVDVSKMEVGFCSRRRAQVLRADLAENRLPTVAGCRKQGLLQSMEFD